MQPSFRTAEDVAGCMWVKRDLPEWGTDSKQADTEEKPGDAANLDQWETL